MTDNADNTTQVIPLTVKVSAVILLVVSIIGIIYYTTASIYQLYNPHFLNNVSINNTQYTNLNIYVILQSISHFGLLISALYLFKYNKIGLYLYFVFTIMLLITEIYFENEFILTHIVSGLLLGIIITISYGKFR